MHKMYSLFSNSVDFAACYLWLIDLKLAISESENWDSLPTEIQDSYKTMINFINKKQMEFVRWDFEKKTKM